MTRAQNPVSIAYGTAAALALVTPGVGELLWDTTNKRLFGGDGATVGGNLIGGVGVVDTAHEKTRYVAKHGNDSNTGKTIDQAYLTIGQAISDVTAPTESSPWAIVVLDGGVYTEGAETIPAHTSLIAPHATIDAQFTLSDFSYLQTRILKNSSANPALTVSAAAAFATVNLSVRLKNESGATGKMIDVSGSGAVLFFCAVDTESLNSAGKIHVQSGAKLFLDVKHLDAGHASAVALDVDGECNGIITQFEVNGGSAIAIDVGAGGVADLRVEKLNIPNTAYTVASGGTLRMSVAEISGTQTANGTVMCSIDGLGGNKGTAFPATPVEGQRFYRTDLEAWFYYDSSRSKWLGDALIELFAMGENNRTTWLEAGGELGGASPTYAAALGHVAQYDLIVVGMSLTLGIASTNTISVMDDGSAVTGASLTATSPSKKEYSNSLNSSTIAEGSIMGLSVTSGTAKFPLVKAFLRRVET